MDGPMKKGDIVEFADGHTIMLGPDGLIFMGVDPGCDEYRSNADWHIPMIPDDAAPISASAIPAPSPIVNGKTPYEQRKEAEESLIESNRRTRDEIRRILGQ